MRILVLGNINAGKTTIANALAHVLGCPLISIDAYRVKYGKGDVESETEAQRRFIADVVATEDTIVECTGLGTLGRDLSAALKGQNGLAVIIDTPEGECLRRLGRKHFEAIPYPQSYREKESIEATIHRTQRELDNGGIFDLWRESCRGFVTLKGGESRIQESIDIILSAVVPHDNSGKREE